MIPKIQHWLTPPTFQGDEEKTIRAILIHITLLSVMGFLVIVMVGNWLGGRTPATVIGINAAVVAVCLLFFYWTRQGKVGLVSIGLVTLGIISITLAVASLGTIRTPTTATYLALVIVAGLLFDLRGFIVMTILSSLAILGLIAAENGGALPPPDLSVTITQWITYTALFGASGGLTIMVLRSPRHALRRAQSEIAERARVEVQLRESEERFRRLYEQTPLGYQSLDAEGRLIEVNQAWLDLLGYSREEVIGRWFGDFLAPHEVDSFKQRFPRFKAVGEVRVDLAMVQRAGSTIIVHIDGGIGRDAQGQCKQTHCILHDITEGKRAEEELRESEARYRALADSITDIFFAMDKDLRYTYWNKASEQLTGIAAEDALGKSLYDLFPDEAGARPAGEYLKVLQTQQPWSFVNEYRIGGKDLVFEISAYPSKQGLSVFIKDITERKRAEETQ
jgi:PAS domain S-box-containing protein